MKNSLRNSALLFASLTIVCALAVVTVRLEPGSPANRAASETKLQEKGLEIDNPEATTTQVVGSIDRVAIAGGGGTSTSGSFRVDATVGETSASSTMNGGAFSINGGFWNTIGTPTASPTPTATPTPTPTSTPTPTPTATPTPSPTPGLSTIQFLNTTTFVGEGNVDAVINVTRTGDTSSPATVDYRTTDTDNFTVGCADVVNNLGGAFGRCDFALSLDTIAFASGETSKTFIVPIIDDSHAEGNETFSVVLSNPIGATLGAPATATVSITDNDGANGPNPIFTTPFFVRLQYLDFLSREPEPGEPWSNVLNNCSDVNNNPLCDRLTVSAAFFGSQEFQLKGYFVYRFYKLAFNRLPTYSEIVVDMRAVTGTTPNEVFQKKAAFTNAFVQRGEFTNQYNGLTNAQYVAALMGRYGLAQITTPDPAAPDGTNTVTLTTTDLTNQLDVGMLTRAQVLRAIADSDQVSNAEFNAAFVAMQYFGYLRRSPDTAGYNAWLNYLNTHPGDSRTMVNGFMNSLEYRFRFGP